MSTIINYVNPHPCGYYGSSKKQCTCLPGHINRYKKRLSGPLLDRIDLHIHVSAVDIDKLTGETTSESSRAVRQRVQKARNIQLQRFNGTRFKANGEMDSKAVKQYCVLDTEGKKMLRQAVDTLNMSARSYYRTIKLARTIADLSGEESIMSSHVAEALQYRQKIDP